MALKEFVKKIIFSYFQTTKEGAESVVYVALSPELETLSGGYYDNCNAAKSSCVSYSEVLQDDLWNKFQSMQ